MESSALFVLVAVAIATNGQILSGKPLSSTQDCKKEVYDIFIVVDGSASIGQDNFKIVRRFLTQFMLSLYISPTTNNFGFLQFSYGVKIVHGLNDPQNKLDILQHLNFTYESGNATRTDLALAKVVKIFAGRHRPNVKRVVIVLTDGNSTQPSDTKKQATKLKQEDVEIFAIGAGSSYRNFNELRVIASKEKYVFEKDFKGLVGIIKPLLGKICVVNTTSAPAPTTTESTTTAMPITTATAPPCAGSKPRDILFVVDGTANQRLHWSTRKVNFEITKGFLKEVISALNEDQFKIGIMQFGGASGPTMEVDFTKDTNMPVIMSQLKTMKEQGDSERWMGEALVMASNKFYELDFIHNRYDAQDVIVLITHGKSWDKDRTKSEIQMLKQRNVLFITIAVGSHLENMANYLDNLFSPHPVYLATYEGLIRNTVHKVLDDVCSIGSGILPEPDISEGIPECGNKTYDIFFVIDGSASINYKNFNKMRKFILDSLILLKRSSSNINVGLMQFSQKDKTEVLMFLEYRPKEEELNSINQMTYQSGGRTMAGDALHRVNNEVFNGQYGDRKDVEKILMLLSDGYAHDISKAFKVAEIIKGKNVRVVTIAAGEEIAQEDLEKLASGPEDALNVNYSELSWFAQKAISIVCKSSKN